MNQTTATTSYTDEQLLSIADQYATTEELANANYPVYKTIIVRGLRGEAFKHHTVRAGELNDHATEPNIAKRVDLLLQEAIKWHTKYVAMEELFNNFGKNDWARVAQIENGQ